MTGSEVEEMGGPEMGKVLESGFELGTPVGTALHVGMLPAGIITDPNLDKKKRNI